MSSLFSRLFAPLALVAALSVPGVALAIDVPADEVSVRRVSAETSTSNDDLVPVALGTLGAVGVAGVVVSLGYLYRRQVGLTEHYDDGFTPRDPRDHAAH